VAWEIPRTRRQPQPAYAASWRRAFASLPPADFPLAGRVLERARSGRQRGAVWAGAGRPSCRLGPPQPSSEIAEGDDSIEANASVRTSQRSGPVKTGGAGRARTRPV